MTGRGGPVRQGDGTYAPGRLCDYGLLRKDISASGMTGNVLHVVLTKAFALTDLDHLAPYLRNAKQRLTSAAFRGRWATTYCGADKPQWMRKGHVQQSRINKGMNICNPLS